MKDYDVCIAIPSHGRTDTIQKRTLPLLDEWGLTHRAAVFVAESELDAYREAVGNRIAVLKGAPGVRGNRHAIMDYVPNGRFVVQMDDDVHGIYRDGKENGERLTALNGEEMLELFQRGFDEMREAGARIWGVYPVANPFFMRDRVRRDLTYIIASFFGYVADQDPTSPLRTLREDGEKEDFERSLQCYDADGSVVRLEYVCVKHDAYAGHGGLHDSRTKERVYEASVQLVDRFPHLATLNTTKKSGWTEVRLRDSGRKRVSIEEVVA